MNKALILKMKKIVKELLNKKQIIKNASFILDLCTRATN